MIVINLEAGFFFFLLLYFIFLANYFLSLPHFSFLPFSVNLSTLQYFGIPFSLTPKWEKSSSPWASRAGVTEIAVLVSSCVPGLSSGNCRQAREDYWALWLRYWRPQGGCSSASSILLQPQGLLHWSWICVYSQDPWHPLTPQTGIHCF